MSAQTLTEHFSPEDIETLISTGAEMYANASDDAHEYLSIRQQGLASQVLNGKDDALSEDDIEVLLITAAELYNNAHDCEEYLSVRQQGLASLALQRLQELQEA